MAQPDLVWYGRAAVWIGSLLLLLMAFKHHQVAIVTVLSVLSIMVGIVLLVYAIPRGSRSRSEEGPGQ